MIDVRFFASIREQLGTSELSLALALAGDPPTVSFLRQQIIDVRGGNWSDVLCADNVVIAVNQEVVDDQYVLSDGDELAFFPPVTGG
jgi:molybdopterin synthase sulfur carrier subunit